MCHSKIKPEIKNKNENENETETETETETEFENKTGNEIKNESEYHYNSQFGVVAEKMRRLSGLLNYLFVASLTDHQVVALLVYYMAGSGASSCGWRQPEESIRIELTI